MTEIKTIHQILRNIFPAFFKTPSSLTKLIKILDPKRLEAKRMSVDGIEIKGIVWVKLPTTASPKGKPRTLPVSVVVSGLTLESEATIPLSELTKTPERLVQGLFLSSLITLGIFTNPIKREAFKALNKLN